MKYAQPSALISRISISVYHTMKATKAICRTKMIIPKVPWYMKILYVSICTVSCRSPKLGSSTMYLTFETRLDSAFSIEKSMIIALDLSSIQSCFCSSETCSEYSSFGEHFWLHEESIWDLQAHWPHLSFAMYLSIICSET